MAPSPNAGPEAAKGRHCSRNPGFIPVHRGRDVPVKSIISVGWGHSRTRGRDSSVITWDAPLVGPSPYAGWDNNKALAYYRNTGSSPYTGDTWVKGVDNGRQGSSPNARRDAMTLSAYQPALSSSPCAEAGRGQPQDNDHDRRFIPVRGGRASRATLLLGNASVHPRARGQVMVHQGSEISGLTSSPNPGRLPPILRRFAELAFIPVSGGGTPPARPGWAPPWAHPHIRGEKATSAQNSATAKEHPVRDAGSCGPLACSDQRGHPR